MQPDTGIVDFHAHIWPDRLAARSAELIEKSSGIKPAHDGTVAQLEGMMATANISLSFVNNVVLKASLVAKANDFTAEAVSKSGGKLLGVGFLAPASSDSVEELDRCKNKLYFKAFKIHNSHYKVFPSDPRNDKIYERIASYKMPVLFHCGENPYSGSENVQYCMPKNFLPLVRSYPELRIVLAHAAGYQDYPEQAEEVVSSSANVFADTAIDFEKKRNMTDLDNLFDKIPSDKFVFGSDYPIQDASKILTWLKKSLPPSKFHDICSENIKKIIQSD